MKIALSLNAINLIVTGAMSAGVVGVTVATVIDNNSNSEPESSETISVEDAEVTERAGEKEEELQEKVKEVVETKEETPKTEATTKPATQPTTKPTQDTPKVEEKKESATTTPKTYYKLIDLENAYKGYCPNDIPDGAWPQRLAPAVALGYTIYSYNGYNDVNSAALWAWNILKWDEYDKSSIKDKLQMIYPNRMGVYPKGEDGVDDLNLLFDVNYKLNGNGSTWKVTWRKAYATQPDQWHDGIASTTIGMMDSLAFQLESRINQLDAQFKAKCGY